VFQTYWVGRLVVSLILLSGLGLFGSDLSNDRRVNAETLISPLKTNSVVDLGKNPLVVEDIPEEVLRTEIYTEARSPVDGKLLSAAEYIELDQSLQERISDIPPRLLVSEKLQRLIDLLKLRKLIRQVIPFF
jgi:hypothetical protein